MCRLDRPFLAGQVQWPDPVVVCGIDICTARQQRRD